jgi:PIN domain nuclease of toxin-antitoxin system
MSVLLDTCALITLANGDLPAAAGKALGDAASAYVSSCSAWEVAIKCKSGRLRLLVPPHTWFLDVCRRHHLTEIPLQAHFLCAAADLPLIHRDPFDRVIVATAMEKNLAILTSDSVIPTYPGVRTVW